MIMGINKGLMLFDRRFLLFVVCISAGIELLVYGVFCYQVRQFSCEALAELGPVRGALEVVVDDGGADAQLMYRTLRSCRATLGTALAHFTQQGLGNRKEPEAIRAILTALYTARHEPDINPARRRELTATVVLHSECLLRSMQRCSGNGR